MSYSPRGYESAPAATVPFRYEEPGASSPLFAVCQELISRVVQLRAAQVGSQVYEDDLALRREKPDGVGLMTAYLEQCLIDLSAHSEAIALLLSHQYVKARPRPVEPVYGQSTAVAVHQRAIIEIAAMFLWLTKPEKARQRYLRLVKELRDELNQWEEGSTAEPLHPRDLDGVLKRLTARYSLDFTKAQQPAARNVVEQEKKSRTQMIQDVLGEEVFLVWKRLSMDAHGSTFLNQFILVPDSNFSPQFDARFRSNAVYESLRQVLKESQRILEVGPTEPPR